MNLEEIKDLKEEICFYDKVVLNKMIEVDINQEFQKNGILIISNINFEKFFLKNSLDIITGLASDKIYSNALKIMNSIINEESYRENIFIKGKREDDFILIFSKNENPNHEIIDSLNKILENNLLTECNKQFIACKNINAKINSQRYQKIIPYRILK